MTAVTEVDPKVVAATASIKVEAAAVSTDAEVKIAVFIADQEPKPKMSVIVDPNAAASVDNVEADSAVAVAIVKQEFAVVNVKFENDPTTADLDLETNCILHLLRSYENPSALCSHPTQ